MVNAVPPEQAAAFAVLRRPQVPTDLLPEDRWEVYQTGLIGRRGLNPALSRRTETALGGVWVIPGDGWLCLSGGGGMVCNPTPHAIAGHMIMWTWTWPRSRPETIIDGLLPDSISEVTLTAADGSAHTVQHAENAYATILSGELASVQIGGKAVLAVSGSER